MAKKTERPVLDRPLKVGGGIQPRLVTVLTPATTFTVGQDFIQNRRAVNSRASIIRFLNDFLCSNYGIVLLGGTPAHLFAIRPSNRLVLIRTCDGTGIVVSVGEALASALDQTNASALIFNESA